MFYCFTFIVLLTSPRVSADYFTPSLSETQYISNDIYQAIDKAMSDVVSSLEWISIFQSLSVPFQVPSCVERTTSYPNSNPFPTTKTKLNICYEEPTDVWRNFYKQAGDLLVSTLNSKYPDAKLKANHIIINTSILGYFDTLTRAVDSGLCDVVTSNTIYSQERAGKVNFNCGYGSSSTGVLLSNKAHALNYSSIQDLQKAPSPAFTVLKGSYFVALGQATFPNASIIYKENYDGIFQEVMDGTVEGIIADAIDLIYWLNNHKQNCTHCAIRLFGETYKYGSFVTRNISSGTSGLFDSSLVSTIAMFLVGMILISIVY